MLASAVIFAALFLASSQAVKINTYGTVGGNGCDFSGLWTQADEVWHSSPGVGHFAKWELGKTPNAFGIEMEGVSPDLRTQMTELTIADRARTRVNTL